MTLTDEPTREELHILQDELARRIVERAAAVADLIIDHPGVVLTLTVEAGLLREQCRQWRGVTLQLTNGDS